MVFVDAHCHLGSRQFDSYREEMIRRMLEKGGLADRKDITVRQLL